jgi:hypothetical protein
LLVVGKNAAKSTKRGRTKRRQTLKQRQQSVTARRKQSSANKAHAMTCWRFLGTFLALCWEVLLELCWRFIGAIEAL